MCKSFVVFILVAAVLDVMVVVLETKWPSPGTEPAPPHTPTTHADPFKEQTTSRKPPLLQRFRDRVLRAHEDIGEVGKVS